MFYFTQYDWASFNILNRSIYSHYNFYLSFLFFLSFFFFFFSTSSQLRRCDICFGIKCSVCVRLEDCRDKIAWVPTSCVWKMSDLDEEVTLRNHLLSLKNYLIRQCLKMPTKVDFREKKWGLFRRKSSESESSEEFKVNLSVTRTTII